MTEGVTFDIFWSHSIYEKRQHRNMDTLVQIYQDGEWYIAIDLATKVADQGKTREEAISRLKIGLKEHYETLLEILEKDKKLEIITVEVPNSGNSSSPLIA